MPATYAWWAWLLIGVVCWFIQLMLSVWTEKGGGGAWLIRSAFIVGMVLSVALGIIRFVKWAWEG